MRVLLYIILFLLSAVTPFIQSELMILGRLLWSALFIYLSITLAKRWIRSRPSTGSPEIEAMFLTILFIHVVAPETGGTHSPVILLYVLVVLFSSFYFSFFKIMTAVAGVFFLEGIHLYLSSSSERLPTGAIFFPLLLMLIPLIVKGYLKSFLQERELLWGKFNRIKSSVDTLEPPPEIHEKMELTHLSEEKRQDEALALADRMEADLENLLQVLLSSRPQLNRAVIFFYSRREEHLWVRAARGRDQIGVNRQKVIRPGEGILGWIAKEKRTVSIADLQSQKGEIGL